MISLSSIQPSKNQAPPAASTAVTPSLLQPHHHSDHLSFPTSAPQLSSTSRRHRRTCVRAIDDHEAYLFSQSSKLKIAVVGFGNFGQFLAKAFIRQGHTVLAHSRSNYQDAAQSLGAAFFADPHDLCEQHPDVIVVCTSIISMESVLRSLPLQRLRRNTLFVDVLSVKEFPKNIFLQVLPQHFDILCTHPMFGPESGKHSWQNLAFVFDEVRIGNEEKRKKRVETFLDIFKKEGCKMVEMRCAEHDEYAAGSQFITHTMGRILEKLELESSPINTKGYETLLNLVENTASDSFELYYGLFMYNKNAMEHLERLDLAFEALKKELFGHLHEAVRKQLFGKAEEGIQRRPPTLAKLPKRRTPSPTPTPTPTLLPPQAEALNTCISSDPSKSMYS